MDTINEFVLSLNISQEMLFMLFVLVTTIIVVMTVGYIFIGVNSPVKKSYLKYQQEKMSRDHRVMRK